MSKSGCELIVPGTCRPVENSPPGVEFRTFASKACGAQNFYTGTATFEPGAQLPFHTHRVSEAIAVLRGRATVVAKGRSYHLLPLECIHIPAFVAHSVRNDDPATPMMVHTSFAEAEPTREFVSEPFSDAYGPLENIRSFAVAESYQLSEGALFFDFFAQRFGASGICGGYGRFSPGSSLPCHIHEYDESITIVAGEAICLVEGRQHTLSGYDTAFVPKGRPHRFLNASKETMAMIWVYAGDEPDRTLLDPGYCSGALTWTAHGV